jgi:hypothetical protein
MIHYRMVARSALSTLSILAVACTAPRPTEGQAEPVGSTNQELILPNPNGIYFANITANGTGCPAGTWEANIDPAGETFTMTFSQYETSLSPGQRISVKDCQLAVKLHSPQGLSYSISSFFYSGYAYLDSVGMSGRQTAKYYFQGNPIDGIEARTDLVGRFEDEYTYQDSVPLPDLVWSPCGSERLLNVSTRVITINNPEKTGTAYMNTLAIDGSVQLKFRLSWRTCPA